MIRQLPGPRRITFDTNPDDCNLACVMCEEHSNFSPLKQLRTTGHGPHRRMSLAVIQRVVTEMAPKGLREIIPSTMGEPLLYRHFDEILALCKEHGVKLNLTTNGTWPHRGPARWGELLCPVASDVKVSWNGARAEIQEDIMAGSPMEKRIQDLRTFLQVRDEVSDGGGNRCGVTLQCTFMERNLEDLPNLVKMAASMGVDRVKGHQVWVHFGELVDEDLRRSPESRARWNRAVEACLQAAQDHLRPDGTPVRLDNFLRLPETGAVELPSEFECPFLGREAWVNHAGRFDPCCAPDVERRTLGSFGFVGADGGMSAIWEGPLYRSLISSHHEKPVCRKCTLRRPPIPDRTFVANIEGRAR
jgi:MoaA/NifB/PqqE/SkfB family radical SAM enzyme